MRTPCQNNPELWVGDHPDMRRAAARACLTCPKLLECRADIVAMRGRGLDVTGVAGGVDYTQAPSRVRAPEQVVCGNPECTAVVTTNGTRRLYCDRTCASRASYLRRGAA